MSSLVAVKIGFFSRKSKVFVIYKHLLSLPGVVSSNLGCTSNCPNCFIRYEENICIVCFCDEIEMFTGLLSQSKQILKCVNAFKQQVCMFCRWKGNLTEKRSIFYHLNHFNIHQIIYLCRQLAGVTHKDELPDQVFTLLSLIKPNVSREEIIKCLGEATEQPKLDGNEEVAQNGELQILSKKHIAFQLL